QIVVDVVDAHLTWSADAVGAVRRGGAAGVGAPGDAGHTQRLSGRDGKLDGAVVAGGVIVVVDDRGDVATAGDGKISGTLEGDVGGDRRGEHRRPVVVRRAAGDLNHVAIGGGSDLRVDGGSGRRFAAVRCRVRRRGAPARRRPEDHRQHQQNPRDQYA